MEAKEKLNQTQIREAVSIPAGMSALEALAGRTGTSTTNVSFQIYDKRERERERERPNRATLGERFDMGRGEKRTAQTMSKLREKE